MQCLLSDTKIEFGIRDYNTIFFTKTCAKNAKVIIDP